MYLGKEGRISVHLHNNPPEWSFHTARGLTLPACQRTLMSYGQRACERDKIKLRIFTEKKTMQTKQAALYWPIKDARVQTCWWCECSFFFIINLKYLQTDLWKFWCKIVLWNFLFFYFFLAVVACLSWRDLWTGLRAEIIHISCESHFFSTQNLEMF